MLALNCRKELRSSICSSCGQHVAGPVQIAYSTIVQIYLANCFDMNVAKVIEEEPGLLTTPINSCLWCRCYYNMPTLLCA